MSEYDFTVQHRAGKKHGNADSLSRLPCKQCGLDEGCVVEPGREPPRSEIVGSIDGVNAAAWLPSLSHDEQRNL